MTVKGAEKDAAASAWRGDPFPHMVADGLWPGGLLAKAAGEFPPGSDPRWTGYSDPEERGKLAGDSRMWGPAVQEALTLMRSPETGAWLHGLTGIDGLVPDLLGGGMHMTGTGGRLDMHRDFSVHPDTGMERRLNMLVFLNPEWDPTWGGVLHLGRNREVGVLPLVNRTVVFECGPQSWHGHPEPVAGEHWRKSLACYWYAPARGDVPVHSTVWMGR